MSSLSELLAVVDCCEDETEGQDTVGNLWKQMNEVTEALRALSFAKQNTRNRCSSMERENDRENQQWVSLTQEREYKRSRQFESGNGLR